VKQANNILTGECFRVSAIAAKVFVDVTTCKTPAIYEVRIETFVGRSGQTYPTYRKLNTISEFQIVVGATAACVTNQVFSPPDFSNNRGS
jgi:hypothetical protein